MGWGARPRGVSTGWGRVGTGAVGRAFASQPGMRVTIPSGVLIDVPNWIKIFNALNIFLALHGGFVDTAVAARWLDDGIAPKGASGRAFTEKSMHGFDLTFAAPRSVSCKCGSPQRDVSCW